jgi:hypothetical protein
MGSRLALVAPAVSALMAARASYLHRKKETVPFLAGSPHCPVPNGTQYTRIGPTSRALYLQPSLSMVSAFPYRHKKAFREEVFPDLRPEE